MGELDEFSFMESYNFLIFFIDLLIFLRNFTSLARIFFSRYFSKNHVICSHFRQLPFLEICVMSRDNYSITANLRNYGKSVIML